MIILKPLKSRREVRKKRARKVIKVNKYRKAINQLNEEKSQFRALKNEVEHAIV